MPISVLLADDHRIVREGLRAALEQSGEFQVVALASTGREALEQTRRLQPDVVVMDISMPDLNGVDATRRLAQLVPDCPVIALSGHVEEAMVKAMLQAGARGYLRKDAPVDELVSALRSVAGGGVHISPSVAGSVVRDYLAHLSGEAQSEAPTLSGREREVLQLIAEGRSSAEMAKRLSLSVKTVESHRRRIMDKLDIRTVAGLTKYAVREGISTLSD